MFKKFFDKMMSATTEPEGLSFTELNDLLWFDGDTVCGWLGIDTDE